MRLNFFATLFVLLLMPLFMACSNDEKQSLNKNFESVRIGDQIWMAKNIDADVSGSFCYNNDLLNCKKYGRLYTWDAAQNVCPEGWRLPTENDFRQLRENARSIDEKNIASVLKSPEWDSLGRKNGFNALPSGYRNEFYNIFCNLCMFVDVNNMKIRDMGIGIWDSLFYFAKGENAFFWSIANGNNLDSAAYPGHGVWYLHKDGESFFYSSLWKDHVLKIDNGRSSVQVETYVDAWYDMVKPAFAFPVRCIKDLPKQKGLEPSEQDEDEKALITKWMDETQFDYHTRCNEGSACKKGQFCGSLKRCQKFCMDPKDSSYVMLTEYQIFKGNPRKEFKEIFQFEFREYDDGVTLGRAENITCTENGFSIEMFVDKYKKNYAFIIDIDRNGTVSFPQKNKACFQLYDIRSQELKKYGEGCNEKRYMSPFPRGELYRFETERTLLF